ncbi:zinc finger protein 862-like isoform X2 [Sparus aurata]|uniref:zinc finger protein 862-like isoform X2 n=1 Tax=Sparus aurata TaxID=8175 RepID=UPI0011C167A6|nr:zinc finger protein 862-like isoform X2 [Sparus aurata]
MKIFREHLHDLHLFFRNSANRTAVLKAAATVLEVDNIKVTEVKDTRWLSQDQAISNLRRNLPAVLAALAEEADTKKDPVARGLYTFCATYRFVAAVYLQADVLPHLSRLSKLFQREDVNFLAIKEYVPSTIATISHIKDSGDKQPPGSHLSHLQDTIRSLNITAEEERGRRRGVEEQEGKPTGTSSPFWARFQEEVMAPYLDKLKASLESRFTELDLLAAFNVLNPRTMINKDLEEKSVADLKLLANHFPSIDEAALLSEWLGFKVLVASGSLKDKSQLQLMQEMASEFEELHGQYPFLSQLSAIALTVPVSSVNCERDFSAMNRIKTDLRNRLQGASLCACLRISINGPPVDEMNYARVQEIFFEKPRRMACSDQSCKLCQ